jgi:hypothetical protein
MLPVATCLVGADSRSWLRCHLYASTTGLQLSHMTFAVKCSFSIQVLWCNCDSKEFSGYTELHSWKCYLSVSILDPLVNIHLYLSPFTIHESCKELSARMGRNKNWCLAWSMSFGHSSVEAIWCCCCFYYSYFHLFILEFSVLESISLLFFQLWPSKFQLLKQIYHCCSCIRCGL